MAKKPKDGDEIVLYDLAKKKPIKFSVKWFDKELIILDSFSRTVPCTWKELEKILDEAEKGADE